MAGDTGRPGDLAAGKLAEATSEAEVGQPTPGPMAESTTKGERVIGDEIELHYEEDARSLHTVLRITDPDTGRKDECMFDNLTTPMHLIVQHNLIIKQEFMGWQKLDAGDASMGEVAGVQLNTPNEWRQAASGSTDEALFIETWGNPEVIA